MSKEYILAIMNKKDGYLVQDIEFKDELRIKINSCDAVKCAKHVAVRDNDAEFTEKALERANKTAEMLTGEGKKYIPVVIECDIKVTTLDGEEIDRMKLVEEYQNNPFEFLKELLD
ncbi:MULTISPECIES: hypothetical protein [Granulicatella]|uniref:hypothetical protein n=1 Tax=Granulicatella TaxID=117563 RepID=UPI00066B496B|nr:MULTISPECIES: hypothetical protein [unclassified Granulicatella]